MVGGALGGEQVHPQVGQGGERVAAAQCQRVVLRLPAGWLPGERYGGERQGQATILRGLKAEPANRPLLRDNTNHVNDAGQPQTAEARAGVRHYTRCRNTPPSRREATRRAWNRRSQHGRPDALSTWIAVGVVCAHLFRPEARPSS